MSLLMYYESNLLFENIYVATDALSISEGQGPNCYKNTVQAFGNLFRLMKEESRLTRT